MHSVIDFEVSQESAGPFYIFTMALDYRIQCLLVIWINIKTGPLCWIYVD